MPVGLMNIGSAAKNSTCRPSATFKRFAEASSGAATRSLCEETEGVKANSIDMRVWRIMVGVSAKGDWCGWET